MAKKNNRESGYDELYDEQDDEQNDEAVEDKQASKGDESDEKVSTGQQQAGDLQTASDRIQAMSHERKPPKPHRQDDQCLLRWF